METAEKKERTKWRWMKYVVTFGLAMNTLITLVVLYVTLKTMTINSAAIATVAALWSIEAIITCVLKMFDPKTDTSSINKKPVIINSIEEDYMI